MLQQGAGCATCVLAGTGLGNSAIAMTCSCACSIPQLLCWLALPCYQRIANHKGERH